MANVLKKTQLADGKVSLVGAGPGDPDLLTIKALKVLKQADLVLADDLVGEGIISLIPKSTKVIHVGKRGGCTSTPQRYIEKLMIQNANLGLHVVRLKGGDPLIFGRGGEELDALEKAGVEVQIVSGITSSIAATAAVGASLTHRDYAQGILFMTGHTKPEGGAIHWEEIARSIDQLHLTLVVYMGISQVERIQEGLLRHLSVNTPVAVAQNASLSNERLLLCKLGVLSEEVKLHQFKSPAIVIVGDALALKFNNFKEIETFVSLQKVA